MTAWRMLHLIVTLAVLLSCSVHFGLDASADTFGKEDRNTAQAYRKSANLSQEEFNDLFGGIGKITCPWTFGTVFLARDEDIIVTSAHIFRTKQNKSKGSPKSCRVRFLFSKHDYYVNPQSIVTGFDIQPGANYDWAVAKLTKPTQQLIPLTLVTASIDSLVGDPSVLVVSAGHVGWKGHGQSEPSFGSCNFLGSYEHPLLFTDCDGGGGASGAPFLKTGFGLRPAVVALMHGRYDFDEPQKLDGRDWRTVSRAVGVTSTLLWAIAKVAGH